MQKTSLYQDSTFRKIVVGSTGLGLACMLGSAAAVRIGKVSGLQFGWHWSILVLAVAVLLWNRRFWNLLWKSEGGSGEKLKRKLMLHLGILVLLGIGTFLYPLRFVERSYWGGILKGLLTAGTFLGTMIALIYKCGKGFETIDAVELERHGKPEDDPVPVGSAS